MSRGASAVIYADAQDEGCSLPGTLLSHAVANLLLSAQIAAEVSDLLTKSGIEVLAAPGESTHIDFVNSTSYEEQLEAAGKAYLDWYMLTQVRGLYRV